MKKTLLLLSALVFVFAAVACKGSGEEQASDKPTDVGKAAPKTPAGGAGGGAPSGAPEPTPGPGPSGGK